MSIATEGKEDTQSRENRDIKIAGKCEKRADAEKETSCKKPKRYLIGFGMRTKTCKSLYVVRYE